MTLSFILKTSSAIFMMGLFSSQALAQSQSDHTMRPGIAPTSRIKQSIPVITHKDNVITRQVTELQPMACPDGYTGSITMARNRMDYLQPQAPSQFSQWVQSENSCQVIIATVTTPNDGNGGMGGESGGQSERGSYDAEGNHTGNMGMNGGFGPNGDAQPGASGSDPGSF